MMNEQANHPGCNDAVRAEAVELSRETGQTPMQTAAERDALRELCGELVEACRQAATSLAAAVSIGSEGTGFDPEDHVVVKRCRTALDLAKALGVGQ